MLSISPSAGLHSSMPSRTTYYVSPTGSASSDGKSPLSPWNFDTLQSKVYEEIWKPGDRVLFEGGQTINKADYFYFEWYTIPMGSSPYVIGSYNGRKATLQTTAGNTGGIFIRNLSVIIQDLIIKGASVTTALYGINLFTDTDGNNKEFRDFQIRDCELDAFLQGIRIAPFDGTARVTNCLIQSNKITNCRTQGIFSAGPTPFLNNITARYNTISQIVGHSDGTTAGGDGILLGSINKGIVEYNKVDGTGGLTNNRDFNLIWIYDAQNSVIRKNEAINAIGTGTDCGAYGLDTNCINCTLEQNYAYNCYGEAVFIGDGDNNIVRFNRFIDCNTHRATGVFYLYGGNGTSTSRAFANNVKIYNNTIYCSVSQTGAVSPPTGVINELATNNVIFANNIFEIKHVSGRMVVNIPTTTTPNLKFYGNSYYNAFAKLQFNWGSTSSSSMQSWRNTVGQEKLNNVDVGIRATAYLNSTTHKLSNPSPIADKGINLLSEFGWDIGTRDYYDQPVRQGVIGADCSVVSSAPVLLLDEMPNDAGPAVSFRKLRSNYTGQCLRLRRASDGVEQDFGFLASGMIDRAAISTFIGASTATVTTWYDQSLKAWNLIQTTVANQPNFVDPGSGIGLPQIRGLGDSKRFVITAVNSNTLIKNVGGASALLVGSINSGTTTKSVFVNISTNTAANARFQFSATDSTMYVGGRRTDVNSYAEISLVTATTNLFTGVGILNYSSASATIYKNDITTTTTGAFQGSGVSSNTNSASSSVGAINDGTLSLNGGIGELIIYPFAAGSNESDRYFTLFNYRLQTP